MIVQCERCESKFELDDGMIKPGGSKVRCSLCKHVFTVTPPEVAPQEEVYIDEALEETVALDSPPVLEETEEAPTEQLGEAGFERAFEEAVSEESVETISPEDIPEEVALEDEDVEAAIGRATEIEETITREDREKKRPEKEEGGEETAAVKTPTKKKKGLRLFPIVLAVIVLIVLGFLAVFFLAPEMLPDSLSFLKPPEKQEITDAGVRRLNFKEVNGAFSESDRLGQLFVIKGVVGNAYPNKRSFLLVKGTILNDKGAVVKRKVAYAGNTFTDEELRTMDVEDINRAAKNRFGKNRVNFNIPPGGSVPFMIIFEKLPENMSEFTVEAVSSTPGT